VVRTSVEERMSVFEGKEGKGTQEEVAVPPVNPSLLAVVDHTVIRHHRQPLARRKALPHHATRALKLQARPRHSPSARPRREPKRSRSKPEPHAWSTCADRLERKWWVVVSRPARAV
jgi:hypothetical protein